MEEQQKVALYGNSLVLAGMGASLKALPDVEVVELGVASENAIHALCSLNAQVVIFDLAILSPDILLTLLEEKPKSMLIGLDAAGERMLLLYGQRSHSLTTTRLVHVIETLSQKNILPAPPPEPPVIPPSCSEKTAKNTLNRPSPGGFDLE